MIKIDQLRIAVFLGAILALFASGSVFAGAHEAAAGDTEAAASIDSEAIESTPATLRDAEELAGLVPELITTARGGEENLLEVPLAISTLTADEIKAAQISDLSDVAALSAGFTFQNFFGQQLSSPTLRGVPQVEIRTGTANAPIYIDGIYVASKTGINFSFLDVERIEVLRGPQPAYFGYNAFSGAVNFVTAKPADEVEINGEIDLGSDEKRRVSVSASGPVWGDQLSGRISAMYDEFGGTYNNANPQVEQDIGGYTYKTLSGSLFYTPTDTFSAQLNLYYSDDEIDPPALGNIPANCEPRLENADGDPDPFGDPDPERLSSYCGDIPSVDENSLATIPGETGQTREVFRTSLDLEWDLSYGTLSARTGYSTTKDLIVTSATRGATGTIFAYQTTTPDVFGTVSLPIIQPEAGDTELDDFSQEIRFTSPRDQRLRYTVGAYYRTTEETLPQLETTALTSPDVTVNSGLWAPLSSLPTDIATDPFGGFPFEGQPVDPVTAYRWCWCRLGADGGTPFFPAQIYDGWFTEEPPGFGWNDRIDTDLWATFFAVEYDINDRWTAYAEGRYTDFSEQEANGTQVAGSFFGADGEPIPGPRPVEFTSIDIDDDFFNWRASLEYHPNDTTTWYGSIATGTKQGGIDTFTPTTLGPDPDCDGDSDDTNDPNCVNGRTRQFTYGSEEITTYELGYKAAYLEGSVVVDAAIYYSDWSDIVTPQIFESIDGKGIESEAALQNVGEASVKGAELSISAQLNDQFSSTLGLSYSKSELDDGCIGTFATFPSFSPPEGPAPNPEDGRAPCFRTADMSGQDLLRHPELQANLSLAYQDQLSGQWDWYWRADANYQDEWFVGFPNQGVIPDRTRVNARVGLASDEAGFTWELYANNVFDDDTVDAAFRDVYFANALPDGTQNSNTLFPVRLTVSHPDRRTVGLRMLVTF